MKVAVFLPNWIGDVVMATPTLRALRHHLGRDTTIVGIMKPYVRGVLDGTPWLDERWFHDPRTAEPALGSAALVRRLVRLKIDVAILLPNGFQVAFLSWLARVKERVGYARYRRGPFLTVKVQPPTKNGKPTPHSTLDYYLELAYRLGCPPEPPTMELATTPDDEREADEIWSSHGLCSDSRVIALNSSSAYGPSKLWPDSYFAELARRIVTELDHDVLVICGPREEERALQITRLSMNPRVVTLSGTKLSIGRSKACLRRSRLLVTTDSGPRHLAAALGTKVLTLFGATHMDWSDIHYDGERRLQVSLECGPCQQPTCPLGHHRCMTELDVEQVFRAVKHQLGLGTAL